MGEGIRESFPEQVVCVILPKSFKDKDLSFSHSPSYPLAVVCVCVHACVTSPKHSTSLDLEIRERMVGWS